MSNSSSVTPNSRMRPAVLAVSAVVAVIGIAVAAFLATRSSDTTTVSAGAASIEMGTVRVEGAALAPMPDGDLPDPAIGTAAPSVFGQGFDGSARQIEPGSGPTVVMFVAHWCPHCQREVPKIVEWSQDSALAGVNLRAVSTGVVAERPNYPPSEWLAREKFTVPTLADDEATTAANAYGLTSFPYFVALDAKGKVVKRASGELSQAQFDELATLARG